MNAFDFAGPQDTVFRIHQDASGVIGCKLYPGALLLCSYLSHKPIPPKSLCLELGAGACGLPSLWLKHSGCDVIATEQECVLPLLEANMGRAEGVSPGKEGVVGEHPTPGRLLCTPLTWGEEGGVGRLMGAMREILGVERVALDYIVAADVVYHDPLIAPLLQTLVELTEGPSEGEQGPPPPIIILSYVQRFKRAKRFFKLAAAHFDVKVVAGPPTGGGGGEATTATIPGGGLCVDYDTLTWTLPKVLAHLPRGTSGVQQGGDGKEAQHTPQVHTHHASYKDFSELVIKAAAVAAAVGAHGSGGACEASESVKPPPPAATSSKHGIDSDSEDEWEASEAFAKNFASTVGGDDSSGSAQGEGPAAQAARQLGLTLPPPSQAYIYTLTRKLPTKKGK